MPVITLSTDIGNTDFVVGAVKGQLLQADATNNIADISHTLSANNYLQAAYICSNAFRHFPKGSFHIILLNVFDNEANYFLIAQYQDQFIICPDNGILTMITGQKPGNVFSIPIDTSKHFSVLQCTQAIANAITVVTQTGALQNVGNPVAQITEKYPLRSTVGVNWIDSQIIHIDQFENVIVNITEDEFEEHRKGRNFKIVFLRNETIEQISRNYASVSPGDKLAWFNAAGYLEIAINKGNIAGLFGLQGFSEKGGQQNNLLYQTIRIFFE
jgi:S-adenosylmethionine hydrolase